MAGQLPADDRLRRRAGIGVLLVLGLALAGVLALVRGVREPGARHVIRPEFPVQGITAGSVVRLSGVPVGRVVKVGLWTDPATGRIRPEIAFVLDAGPALDLPAKVAAGLRARCIPVNPASGLLEVDLVWSPGAPALTATADPGEIPWEVSPQQLATDRAAEMAQRVAAADLRAQVDLFLSRLADAEARVSGGVAAPARLAERAARLRAAAERLDRAAGADALGVAQGRLGELREGLRATESALDAFDGDLRGWSGPAGESLRDFARSCRETAARLRRQVPEAPAR